MEHLILCRYGELWLKSRPVMEKFYARLISNMHRILAKEDITFKIRKQRNRAFVETDNPKKAIEVLIRIFGLISISPVLKVDMDYDLIEAELIKLAEKKLKGNKKSFAVKVKRVGTHDITSKEMESRWGYSVGSRYDNPVNLTKPDVSLNVEVRNDVAYIFTDTYPCAGGLPIGVEGTVAALINNENDLASAYLMMKRGCSVVALAKNKNLAEKLNLFTTDLMIIEYKKDWMSALKDAIEEHGVKALVSGETLENMTNLEKIVNLPILRPLVGLDNKKMQEIRALIGI
ncbi:MAG: THUMP domain-containing protein [archaeon]|nr:THUMP domain-containing protein [archaeon]